MSKASQVTSIDDAVVEAPVATEVIARPSLSGSYEILTIHSSDGDGGTDAVPVGINGYAYQIPRDKPTKVPSEVVSVLRDAVVTTLRPGSNGDTTEHRRPRFAFSSVPA